MVDSKRSVVLGAAMTEQGVADGRKPYRWYG